MIINNLRMATFLYDDACKRASDLEMGFEKYIRTLIANDLATVSTLEKGNNNDNSNKNKR
ncbi:hypothetical protein ABDC18_002851 [Escherichia coli]